MAHKQDMLKDSITFWHDARKHIPGPAVSTCVYTKLGRTADLTATSAQVFLSCTSVPKLHKCS